MTEKNLVEMVEEMHKEFSKGPKIAKTKKLKIPRKAKVRKRKQKKGWIGCLKIEENGTIKGEKIKISDSVFKCKEKDYHATDGREILFWDGKFPVVIQESKKKNPKIFKFNEGDNEVYGQKYIMAKMMKDVMLGIKKKGGAILWVILIIAALIGYNMFFGG